MSRSGPTAVRSRGVGEQIVGHAPISSRSGRDTYGCSNTRVSDPTFTRPPTSPPPPRLRRRDHRRREPRAVRRGARRRSGSVIIGGHCIIMEQAVLRGTARHPVRLADHVLGRPHAHLSGCTVEDCVFVATGAASSMGATRRRSEVADQRSRAREYGRAGRSHGADRLGGSRRSRADSPAQRARAHLGGAEDARVSPHRLRLGRAPEGESIMPEMTRRYARASVPTPRPRSRPPSPLARICGHDRPASRFRWLRALDLRRGLLCIAWVLLNKFGRFVSFYAERSGVQVAVSRRMSRQSLSSGDSIGRTLLAAA